MTWWGWFLLGAALPYIPLAVIFLVGSESHERRGTLELDTPEAREALRNGGEE